MKNILIGIIVLIQVLLFSCTNKGKDYTISGILYRDCSKTQVMRGVSIQVEGRKVGMGGGLTLGSGITDDSGHFSSI